MLPQIQWLKTTSICISHFLWVRSWSVWLSWFSALNLRLKFSCWQDCFLQTRVWGRTCSLFIQVVKIQFQEVVGLRSCYLLAEFVLSFWVCLHLLAHGSLQSQQQWVECFSSLESDSSPASFIQGISSVFFFCFKGSICLPWAHQIISDILPILRSLIPSAKSFCQEL